MPDQKTPPIDMSNILSQLPPELKEIVDITRESAFEGDDDIIVAEGIECYINPAEDLITTDGGVAIRYLTYKMHLGKPIANVKEGDQIQRANDSRNYTVYRVRGYGTAQMNLTIRSRGVL